MTEILLPIRGEVRVSAAFESRTLREGEFWFINHRAIHSLQSEDGALIALIHVNHGYYSSRFPDLPYMFFRSSPILDAEGKMEEGFADISQEEKSRFCSLLIELLRHELLPEPSSRERRNLGCRLIYTMIYDFYWLRFIESAEGLVNASHLERYHRIVKYIQEHYAERISLDVIVAGEDGTKAYFSQFLKTFTNNSFTRRVNYERIIKSEFMLLSGHPVLKISGLCGFSDGKYFYQTFKKWYGCLPGDHRKRCQAYSRLGVEEEEVTPTRSRVELERFAGRLSSERKRKANPPETLINPFEREAFLQREGGELDFQWDYVDRKIRLAREAEVPVTVVFLVDQVEPEIFCDGTARFLEGALNRYGKSAVRQWCCQVYYEDPGSFDKSTDIERLIGERLKGARIRHFFGIGLKIGNR